MSTISRRISEQMRDFGHVEAFFERSAEAREAAGPDVCDFIAGDPQEMALPRYVDALASWTAPKDPQWFAYKMSEPQAQEAAARALNERFGHAYEPGDLQMTNGAIAGLAVTMRALCDQGDEVVILTPPHFLYPVMIRAAGAEPVRVAVGEDLQPDLEAIEAAFTERTRAIIVNSPHNPTGKIFDEASLRAIGELVDRASEEQGRPVYLVSDEAYNRVIFDDRPFPSPAAATERSLLVYTYGKTLLTPGQRVGYIAVHPDMPEKDEVIGAIVTAQIETGWAFPNALLQHALGDLEDLSIDIAALQAKRDRMVEGLREIGYELYSPEATFYLMPRSPLPDDERFWEMLAERGIIAMPGHLLEVPSTFRLSLTATEEMVERSLPGFEDALRAASG